MPKFLPCDTCRDHATGPDGKPLWAGRIFSRVMTYKCYKCRLVMELPTIRWNGLSEVSEEELRS